MLIPLHQVHPPKPYDGNMKTTSGGQKVRPKSAATNVLLPGEGKCPSWCPTVEGWYKLEQGSEKRY